MIENNFTFTTIKIPEKSKWTLKISNVQYTPNKDCEPNWFQRIMWRFLLGGVWTRND